MCWMYESWLQVGVASDHGQVYRVAIQLCSDRVSAAVLGDGSGWQVIGSDILTSHDDSISILVNLLVPSDSWAELYPDSCDGLQTGAATLLGSAPAQATGRRFSGASPSLQGRRGASRCC